MSITNQRADFEKKIRYKDITFSYSNKSKIEEREIHTYHEILYYIDGDTTLTTVTYNHKLAPGTLVIIPEESYHYLSPSDDGKFHRLKIGFYNMEEFSDILPPIMNEIRIIENLPDDISIVLSKICDAFDYENEKTAALCAYGSFLVLLSELLGYNAPCEDKGRDRNPVISKCIKLIDRDIGQSIKISEIAKSLNISESALSHNFRKEIGISFHKYVTQRRLVYAEKMLNSGEKPTKIYAECGYRDYSSFYKAFVKLHGYPPSGR